MYKSLLILFFAPLIFAEVKSNYPSEDFLSELRVKYYASVEDEEALEDFEKMINKSLENNRSDYPAILLAYQGGLEAVKAKHAFWPFSKMTYLSESMDLLSEAIDKDGGNLEIRFIRFSILHHVPGILGYGKETSEDAEVLYELIIGGYDDLELSLQRGIAEFLIRSERLTEDQNHKLSRKFALINFDE